MNMENLTVSVSEYTSTKGSNKIRRFKSVEESLKPLLVSLKIFGVYFDPTPSSNKAEDSETASPKKESLWLLSCITSRMYCVIVLLFLWFNFVRCVVGLVPFDEDLPIRVIITTWNCQNALISTIMLVSCQRLTHFRSFYKHWDSLFKNSVTQNIGCGFRCPGTYLKVATVVGWMLVIINNTIFFTLEFGNLPPSRQFIINIIRPFPESQWAKILATVAYIIETGAWIFPVIFLSTVCRVIQTQFLQFRCCLSKQIDEADGCIPDRLGELRCRFTQLCQTVEILNRVFKWILGVSFVLEIFLACFISYQVINSPFEIINLATFLFWQITCFLVILVQAISSSHVNDAAHSLIDVIFRVGTKNATAEQLGQLNLFVAKLTGTSIGFTAIDFFVITKEFLLSLGGLYITYFFLLLQFRIA